MDTIPKITDEQRSDDMYDRQARMDSKPKAKLDRSTRRIYKTQKGLKVPGVTTVLNILNKPALLDWSAKEERKGVMDCLLNKKIMPDKYFYTMIRDTSASIGTICHFMCECFLKGEEPDLSEFLPEEVEKAKNGFRKFVEYWNQSGFKILHNELALVDDEFEYGGSLDIVCTDKDGNIILLDLKTSKALYSEYWVQISAYRELYNNQNEKKITRCIIVRIGKEEVGDMEFQENNALDNYFDLFLGALACHKSQKAIRKEERNEE